MYRKRDSLEYPPTGSGELHSELTSGQHLPYDLMEAYVDGRLRRDRIGFHLLRCKNCSEELENLLGFARACEMSEEVAVRSVGPGRLEEVAVRSAEPARLIVPKRTWFTRRSLLVGAQVVIGWSALASVVILAAILHFRALNTAPTIPAKTKEEHAREAGDNYVQNQVLRNSQESIDLGFDFDSLSPDLKQIFINSFTPKGIQRPQVLDDLMSGQSGTLNRGTEEYSQLRGQVQEGASPLLSPVGTVVSNTTPTFRWTAVREADSYMVRVYDEALNLVESSPRVTITAWKSRLALQPGRIYSWQITAMSDAEEITPPLTSPILARFKVLDAPQRRQLEELNRTYPGAHLLLGVIAAHAGLLDDAEHQFRAVPKSDPQYRFAQKFLQDLQLLRKPTN